MQAGEDFIELSTREFRRLKDLADKSFARASEDQFFSVPAEGDNSLATLCKHMAGNMLSRWTDFQTSDGEKPWRHRDDEFRIGHDDTRISLMRSWEEAWTVLFDELSRVEEVDLQRDVYIRREPLTVLQAIARQLTHYAYHVGQIVYLSKHYAGKGWQSLSIPLGQSEAFNQGAASYLGSDESETTKQATVAADVVEVRPMRASDGDEVVRLAASLPEWFDQRAREISIPLDVKHNSGYVALREDRVVGFVVLHVTEGRLVIDWLAVSRELHGKGIGKRLTKEAESRCRELGLEAMATYTLGDSVDYAPYEATRAFYFRQGFRIVQRSQTDNASCPEEWKLEKRLC